jgi:hypothetical protein
VVGYRIIGIFLVVFSMFQPKDSVNSYVYWGSGVFLMVMAEATIEIVRAIKKGKDPNVER